MYMRFLYLELVAPVDGEARARHLQTRAGEGERLECGKVRNRPGLCASVRGYRGGERGREEGGNGGGLVRGFRVGRGGWMQ
jgi:hypothetical protein